MKNFDINQETRKRINLLLLGFTFFAIIILAKLFTIQVKDKSYYEALAKKQHLSRTVLNPIRGMIYDRHLDILATNSIKYSFSVNPRDLSKETKVRLANLFSKVFGKTTNYYQEKFNSKKYFVWVENEITENQAEPILRAQEKDIYIHKIPKRFYPRKELAGQVIGYTDTDNLGQSGIEKTFNSILSGEPGFLIEQNDGWGRSLPSLEYPEKKAINGSNLVLTIDAQFQAIAQEELVKAILEKKADGGMCVIMNPKTGAVLAMVSYPQIDPNNSRSFSQEALKNKTITDIFEPGSTFKLVACSSALEKNILNPMDSVFCENGKIRLMKNIFVKDAKPHGWLKFHEVFSKSSNIGTIKIADKLGSGELYRFARAYGFGSETNIELIGEVGGILKNPVDWSGISRPEISIGQEVAVTALQITNAYCTIANGGELMQPMIVKAILDDQMKIIETRKPKVIRRVVAKETAEKFKQFLEGTTQKGGTAEQAAIPGLRIGGKTGTAQKVSANGYSQKNYVSSFIGMFPLENPQIVCLVMIDNIKEGYYWGGYSSGPVFKKITERIIRVSRGIDYQIDKSVAMAEVNQKKTLPKVTVPDLKRLEIDNAKAVLEEIGLEIKFLGKGTTIVSQEPKAGEKIDKLSFVHVTLDNSKPVSGDFRETPFVVGLSVKEAINRLALEQIDFKVEGNGVVKQQNPEANTKVRVNSVCKLSCEEPKTEEVIREEMTSLN